MNSTSTRSCPASQGAKTRRVSFLVAALMSVGLSTATFNPTPARANFFSNLVTPSANDQIRLGDQAAAEIHRKYRMVDDERAQRFSAVCQRILAATPNAGPWHWTFELADSKDINAFALPGGHTFMYTGLLDKLTTDDQIAAVMGHEMTHVILQHWAKETAAQQTRALPLEILLGITRAGNTWRTIAGLTNSMMTLKFSRSEESQADMGGLETMVKAGYDPNGMVQLFHVLQAAGGGGGPEFLSDHPLTTNRIRAVQAQIRKMGYQPEQ